LSQKNFAQRKKESTYKMAEARDELVDIGPLGISCSHPADLTAVGVPIAEK
jgi:hypothetical protein